MAKITSSLNGIEPSTIPIPPIPNPSSLTTSPPPPLNLEKPTKTADGRQILKPVAPSNRSSPEKPQNKSRKNSDIANVFFLQELAEIVATRQGLERAWHARLMICTTVYSNVESTIEKFSDEIEKEEVVAFKVYLRQAIANFSAIDNSLNPPKIPSHSKPIKGSGYGSGRVKNIEKNVAVVTPQLKKSIAENTWVTVARNGQKKTRASLSNKTQITSVNKIRQQGVNKEKSPTAPIDKRLFVRLPQEYEWRKLSTAAVGKRPNKKSGRSAPWWTLECKLVHLDYRDAVEEPERSTKTWTHRTTVTKKRALEEKVSGSSICQHHSLLTLRHEGQFITDQAERATILRDWTLLSRFSASDEFPPCKIPGEMRIPWLDELPELEVRKCTIGSGNTSPGADGIFVELLGACWEKIELHVTHLFRACLRLCCHSSCFKLAEIVFIPKARVQVRFHEGVTEAKELVCGAPQGSPISPLLFLLYMAEPMKSGNSIARFSCTEESEFYAFDVIQFSGRRREESAGIMVDGKINLPAENIRWLGVYLDPSLSFKHYVSTWCGKALTPITAVDSCVAPVATFGAEVWWPGLSRPKANGIVKPPTSFHCGLIDKVLHIALRAALLVWRTTQNVVLHKEGEGYRLRFSTRLNSLNDRHPLRTRTNVCSNVGSLKHKSKPRILKRPECQVQRALRKLPKSEAAEPLLALVYTQILRIRTDSSQSHQCWICSISTADICAYSDGSSEGPGRSSWGYILQRGGNTFKRGH
ncbi:hypothetical protein EPUL_002447 [Erysiphe pulchra]|uniref:Reverse transcriptase domain-containing protein n=1 Tax=Erysiphe pulchra TaxID=225359 RepID=A0A2S4PSK4_9PEZI|nr:hypothetical protein EPUL_002447 [Erysiphe pulchra]